MALIMQHKILIILARNSENKEWEWADPASTSAWPTLKQRPPKNEVPDSHRHWHTDTGTQTHIQAHRHIYRHSHVCMCSHSKWAPTVMPFSASAVHIHQMPLGGANFALETHPTRVCVGVCVCVECVLDILISFMPGRMPEMAIRQAKPPQQEGEQKKKQKRKWNSKYLTGRYPLAIELGTISTTWRLVRHGRGREESREKRKLLSWLKKGERK